MKLDEDQENQQADNKEQGGLNFQTLNSHQQ
jgi:hypothetical protein